MTIRIEDIEALDFSGITDSTATILPPIHPGEILLNEFLIPLDITQYRLAKSLGVPQQRISEIVTGKRAITADTGLRLSRFFGLNDGFWVGLQTDYDTAKTKDALTVVLDSIKPWQAKAA
jgi:addiction module HigA family antidote